MDKRTVLEFTYNDDIWNKVDIWAPNHGFKIKEDMGDTRIYQKGVGFWVAPMMLKVKKDGMSITIEAWVRANIFVRISALFLIPPEMHINPGGFKMMVPRNIARKAVNELLISLGQPEID